MKDFTTLLKDLKAGYKMHINATYAIFDLLENEAELKIKLPEDFFFKVMKRWNENYGQYEDYRAREDVKKIIIKMLSDFSKEGVGGHVVNELMNRLKANKDFNEFFKNRHEYGHMFKY
jgi:hypothetical protein